MKREEAPGEKVKGMPIGVGLIGLGMATAPHMMSLRELEESGRVRIIGGHAPSATRRDAFTARWDAPVFAEQAALLAAPGLDLVLVLTPPGAHQPVAQAAIAAGKHILVEKPIELTVARGEALAAAAEAAGVRCGVCLQHRFRPAAAPTAWRARAWGSPNRSLPTSAGCRSRRPASAAACTAPDARGLR